MKLSVLSLALIGLLANSAQASLMQATVSGTVSSGFDAYRNSVYFGPNNGYNLNGMAASVTIVYETNLAGPNQGIAPNWNFFHGPSYFDGFQGMVGASLVRSASFTINGITLAMDVSGAGERSNLNVSNPSSGLSDSYLLGGADERYNWCANDRQCVERVYVSAYQGLGDDLFGGQHNFNPADTFTATPAPGRVIEGYARLIQSSPCLNGGQYAGTCPEGRFADTNTHWVEFLISGTQLTVSNVVPAPGGQTVPEPSTLALIALGLIGAAGMTRRRSPRA